MVIFDLRFPDDIRRTLASLAALVAEAGPDAVCALATPPPGDDEELAAIWWGELHDRIEGDTGAALDLLQNPLFGTAPVELPDDAAFASLRGFTTLRLTLRETALKAVPDTTLETGRVDRRQLSPTQRHALACYGMFGSIQEALCAILED